MPHGWAIGDPIPRPLPVALNVSEPSDWALAYARQAEVDLAAWDLLDAYPEAVAAECHRLLFLQMACEKLCKAFLIEQGTSPANVQTSHGYITHPLPVVIRREIVELGQDPDRMVGLQTLVRHLAGEIELLNPSIRRAGRRPDNCEYPWEVGGRVISPLDWSFPTPRPGQPPWWIDILEAPQTSHHQTHQRPGALK